MTYPNKANITGDQNTPLPIEMAYFIEDSEPDNTKSNRYYFNFPAEWCTSNRGESIIGVRNIFMNPRRRKLEFTIGIRKYYREDYTAILKAHPEYGLDLAFTQIPPERKSETSFDVISWLPNDKDLREIFKDLNDSAAAHFEVVNEEIEAFNKEHREHFIIEVDKKINELSQQSSQITGEIENLDKEVHELQTQIDNETNIAKKAELTHEMDEKIKLRTNKRLQINELKDKMDELEKQKKKDFKPYFQQEIEKLRRRDIQMDGFYSSERNCFIETIESPKNANPKNELEELDKNKFKYYVDLKITFKTRPLNDYSQEVIYDFADVMNIGLNPFQNNPDKYMSDLKGRWMRKIEFENVWDRHSFKIYSSIAEESSKGYLGNSQIFYQPIKYFKLNSTDQRFWIEFYSGRFHKIPVKIPLNESFVIEIQLLPFNKLLYI